jgi:hypothetical protein
LSIITFLHLSLKILFDAIAMILQELQNQVLNLPSKEKWQLLQTLLNAIQKDTTPPESIPERTYPLRGLPITISDDFDEPMSELWEATS